MRRPRTARVAAVVAAVAAVLALLAAVVVVWPQGLGVADVFGPAQLVAMRGVGVLAGVALAAVVGIVAVALRRTRAVAVPVAVVAIAASVVSLTIMAQRGWSDDAAAGDDTTTGAAGGGSGDVRVLAFNTLYDQVPPQDIADLVERHDVDVVVLPETSLATTQEVADRVGGMQVRHRHIDAITSSTGLLVADRLGPYGEPLPQADGHLGSYVVKPEGDGPPIVAVHAYPPGTGVMPWWKRDTVWAVEQCTSLPGAIVAGDFNATLDHPALREHGGCVDAAAERDAAAVGTWPATWPAWLGAPIDHVLVDARTWDVVSFSVLDAHPGSDHRPVLAVLRRR
ncbi:MAG TPA: endonuclease/exonuclease/phosphatase family protein [Jiangellaceae bacterium]